VKPHLCLCDLLFQSGLRAGRGDAAAVP